MELTIIEQLESVIERVRALIPEPVPALKQQKPKPELFDVPEGVTIFLNPKISGVSGIICGNHKLLYNKQEGGYEIGCLGGSNMCSGWAITPAADLAIIECKIADLKPGDICLSSPTHAKPILILTSSEGEKLPFSVCWQDDHAVPAVWDWGWAEKCYRVVLRSDYE